MSEQRMVPVELLNDCIREAGYVENYGLIKRLRAIIDGPGVEPVVAWIDGVPPFPQNQEWFIATTIYDEKVVLRALPEEYAYDYTTADYTYIKASNIRCWMQFPDCEYLPPKAAPSALVPPDKRVTKSTLYTNGDPASPTQITVDMVKELREKTDAPMLECKKALVAAHGDMAKAAEILTVYPYRASAPVQAVRNVTNAQLIKMSELLREAANCLRKVQDDDMTAAWDKFAIRDWLPDELDGSVGMLAAAPQPSATAQPSAVTSPAEYITGGYKQLGDFRPLSVACPTDKEK